MSFFVLFVSLWLTLPSGWTPLRWFGGRGPSRAVELFNNGRFAEFQDALEGLHLGHPRRLRAAVLHAAQERLAEALLQLSDGDAQDAEEMIAHRLRKLDDSCRASAAST